MQRKMDAAKVFFCIQEKWLSQEKNSSRSKWTGSTAYQDGCQKALLYSRTVEQWNSLPKASEQKSGQSPSK